MGVFARLRRKSKRTAEEVGPTSPAVEATEDGTASPEGSEAVPDTGTDTEADTVAGSGSDGGSNGDGGEKAAEDVGIPKQQTVDEAADNGAGEGARA